MDRKRSARAFECPEGTRSPREGGGGPERLARDGPSTEAGEA
ncbi:hypothetical protein [Halorubrum aquaticum]|nr:hypothetical protein [Halorubrum aquaticum]